MAPELNMTELMNTAPGGDIELIEAQTTSPSTEMADTLLHHQQGGPTTPLKQTDVHSTVHESDLFDELEALNSHRTESTATDDSGIAAEFDYQNLDLDEHDVECDLGNSNGSGSLKACTSSSIADSQEEDNVSSTENSPRIDGGHVPRTPTRRKQLSTEDENLSPRQRWWSQHRAVCSDSLDSIAAEKRRRSKGDISKRTAWLRERTESALEKSALVRKRSAELIKTGKRLRNEDV